VSVNPTLSLINQFGTPWRRWAFSQEDDDGLDPRVS